MYSYSSQFDDDIGEVFTQEAAEAISEAMDDGQHPDAIISLLTNSCVQDGKSMLRDELVRSFIEHELGYVPEELDE